MRNYFSFAGTSCREFGVFISGEATFGAPKRSYSKTSVNGRNGDVLINNRRFENFTLVYPAFIIRDFRDNFRDFRAFLMSVAGYQRLEDTYHPEEYRMAYFSGSLDPEPVQGNTAGQFDLEFNCKPQRFLKSGEQKITRTDNFTIVNPTRFPALPLLRVYGAGVLGIGDETITITNANEYTDIDCDLMDAYKGTANRNRYIVLSSGEFPSLPPGKTGISLGSGITKVIITPRWWTV